MCELVGLARLQRHVGLHRRSRDHDAVARQRSYSPLSIEFYNMRDVCNIAKKIDIDFNSLWLKSFCLRNSLVNSLL